MKSQALRIGLIGSGDDSSSKLLRLLAEQGMQIVHALLPKDLTDAHIAATDLDVWLLDLDDSHWHDQLDELMDRSSVPIFFNEHQAIDSQQHLDYWCRNLISRMFELVADVPGLPAVNSAPAAVPVTADTVHIAFPAATPARKTESKPSDELTPAPAALDPELLQEIEELEQLLHAPDTLRNALPDLDDALPLPAAQDDFVFTPAAPAKTTADKTAAAKPAAETPAAEKPTVSATSSVERKSAEPANSGVDAPAKPLDPVAAAKERAAKIKQQAAANQSKAAPVDAAPAEKPLELTAPAATTKPVPAPPAAKPAVTTASVSAPTEVKPAAAGSTAPAAQAQTSLPITPAVSAPITAPTKPSPATPATPAPTSAVKPAATAASTPATTAAEQAALMPKLATSAPATTVASPVPPVAEAESKTRPTVSLDIAALEPAVTPPEKHDWPSFPAPQTEPTKVEPAASNASIDFAPIQPQPAAGPMREPARPLSVVPSNVPTQPAASKAAAGPAAADDAAAANATRVSTTSYAEPVPTLTPASMDDLEFEAVDFVPTDEELEPHADFDVPMLESVASANASEFEAVTDLPPALPCDLWILGASLGGPAALKRFFTALDQPLPICFLLAQHIDAHFLPVLGKILEQANPFYAVQVLARPGLIEPGSLLLAPIEKRLRFLDAGQIVHSGRAWTPPYSPCIDDVLSDVASAYPGQVHAIVFSGMGEDGVDGARAIRDGQGQIWVQEAESCASSVMPDAIHQAGLAHYRATPEQLASRLMARYRQSADSKNLA